MKLMLDTNICIFIIKRKPSIVLELFLDYRIGDIGISSITLAELRYGVAMSKNREKNANALDQFIAPLEIATFDEEAALAYDDIRTALEKTGASVGPMDMLIAAHALSLRATLVTNNTREFSRIPRLDIIDWTSLK